MEWQLFLSLTCSAHIASLAPLHPLPNYPFKKVYTITHNQVYIDISKSSFKKHSTVHIKVTVPA